MTHAGISGAQGSWACSENESTDRLTADVRKILFVENLVGERRRERLHIGEYRGTRETGDHLGQGGEWVLYPIFALPDGGDAFQMQTGVS
jgi:hypothetical protein